MKTILAILLSTIITLASGLYDYPYLTNQDNKIDSKMDKKLMYGDFERILRFDPVYFIPETNMMKEDSNETLQKVQEAFEKYQDRKLVLTIIGYTDHVQTQTEKINQSTWYPTYTNDLSIESAKEDAHSYATDTYEKLLELGVPKEIMIVQQRRGLDNMYERTIEHGRDLNYRAMISLYVSKDKNSDSDNDGIIDSLDKCPLTPKGHPVNSDGCSEILNLTIYYNVDSAKIRDDSMEKLEKLIEFMNKYPEFKAVLYGHTSSEGTKVANQILSEKRALSIKKFMTSQGISSSRISAYGKASTQPVQELGAPEIKELNRRVEIKLH
jgi:outer membrane protein OmpA-like peptidoglycan-associated protein